MDALLCRGERSRRSGSRWTPNLQPPRPLGTEETGERLAGRVYLEALCDVQVTLPFASAGANCEGGRLLLELWRMPKGAFVLPDDGDGEVIGVPLSKKEVMLLAFQEFDRWRR